MDINQKTRVYIAGCGGMLGEAMYKIFNKYSLVRASDIDLSDDWIDYADVRNYQEIEASINNFQPDILINLAAITDMELCEIEEENAWLTNTLRAENLGLISNKLDIPYIYISTAGIFGGEKEFFNDFDIPNPKSVYAKSKYAGELFVIQNVKKYYVVRAGWMMGGGPKKDKKFINKIYKQIISGKNEIKVVNDKFGTPTYTKDFANCLLNLIKTDLYGIYNMVCNGSCNRFDVASEFIGHLGLNNSVSIDQVNSEYFSDEYFAPRPKSEKLINQKLAARNLNTMRPWEICLKEYAKEYIDDLKNRKIKFTFNNKNKTIDRNTKIHIVSVAPSPHNNYLFEALGNSKNISLYLYYVFKPKNVPGRPWKKFTEKIANHYVRSGVNKYVDLKLIRLALFSSKNDDIFFIIGWNYLSLYLLILILGIRKKPFLMWFDTPNPHRVRRKWSYRTILKQIIIRFINRSEGTIFATGNYAINVLKKMGIKYEKIRQLPFFIPNTKKNESTDLIQNKLRKKYRLPSDKLIFLAAGRLIYSKGYDILLQAINILKLKNYSEFTFIIIGSGEEKNELKSLSQQLELDGIVNFIDWVEPEQLEEYMFICDVFIAPARFDPFPTTIIQAMAIGKVVIASNRVYSAVEFIDDNINGFLFNYGDPVSLSHKMIKVIRQSDYIKEMGNRSFIKMQKWPVSRGVNIIYQSVISIVQLDKKFNDYYSEIDFYVNRRKETYSHELYENDSINQKRFTKLKEFIKNYDLNNKKCLEIGSGTGILQDIIENYTGTDVSDSLSRYYHKPYKVANGTKYPFSDQSFDVIWSLAVFEHIPEIQIALLEIKRIIRNNGYVYFAPAWQCRPWAADGYAVRPYKDFGWKGKIIKFLIPIRNSILWRSIFIIPKRFYRHLSFLFGKRYKTLRLKKLKPNWNKYWISDSDACNSIDPHDAILWFESNGFKCLSHPLNIRAFFIRSGALIFRRDKNIYN